MKKLALVIALVGAASLSYGQGLVTLVTAGTSPASGRVSDSNGSIIGDTAGTVGTGGVGLNGSLFFAQLWYAAGSQTSDASFQPVSTKDGTVASPVINFRNGVNSGFLQQSGTTSLGVAFGTAGNALSTTVWLQGVTGGGAATVELRAWYGLNGTVDTWAKAIASSDSSMRYAISPLFYLPATGDALATPTPGLPVALNGFPSIR